MTALAGFVGKCATAILHERCAAILAAQADFGFEPPSIATTDGAAIGVALHCLLPCDSADRQPLVGNGRFLVAADIRVDNRDELISALALEAGERPVSDAEIFLEAWSRWGGGCLGRLLGEFAVAVFDKSERSLTLARDATGQRPLFFALIPGGAAFASMPLGLTQADESLRRWNLNQFAERLARSDCDAAATYFRGVQKIFPGEVVRIRGDEVSRDVFWHPETIERWQLSVEAAAERYLDLLDSAVACRLRRQSGRVGVHLSSGYDTNAVASSVALQCPSGEVRAYTAAPSPQFKGYVPRGRNADESPLASLTARKYGLHHRIVRSPGMSLDFLRRQARFYQEPFVNVMNALWSDEILCAARDDGATVLLNGALGNATLNAGGLRYLPEWIRQRGIFAWWKQARIAAKRSDVRLRGVAYNSLVPWLPFGSLIAQKIAGTRPSTDYSFFRPEFARQSTHTEHPGASIASGSTAEFRLFSIRQYDPGQLYKGGLGLSGIWELDPLSDRRIVEFSLGYPADRLILDGEYRPIAMKALRERVPAAVLKSDKPRGLQAADWQLHFTSREANDILDEIESRDVAKSLLDTAAMRLAIRQWPKGDITDEAIVDRYAWRLAIALSMGVFMTEVEDQWRERPALRRSTPALTC